VGPGEEVKPRLSQALTRGARPDSNSRPAVQISNPLPSRYAPWGLVGTIWQRVESLDLNFLCHHKFQVFYVFFSLWLLSFKLINPIYCY
jgi:hypothetical protein